MIRLRWKFRFASSAVAMLLPTALAAAEMPSALRGIWSGSGENGSCSFVILPHGYEGRSDGEGYSCDVEKIAETGASSWHADFVCQGEFGTARIASNLTFRQEDRLATLEMINTVHPADADKVQAASEQLERCEP